MSALTSIEWTDRTWNPVRGCALVSPGCTNCYAMRVAHRFSASGAPYDGLTKGREKLGPVWTGQARFIPSALVEPLSWRKPQRIFVNSMSDLFHDDITNEQIAAVFGAMAAAPQHKFQLLTKRPERMRRWFDWLRSLADEPALNCAALLLETEPEMDGPIHCKYGPNPDASWPLPNVWIGVSVEDQQRADERIPHLLATPAAVRFLSCEPLLGAVRLDGLLRGKPSHSPFLDWVICGGESGPGSRPMHPAWTRSLRNQCGGAGVPFFFKQWGDWIPIDRPWAADSPPPLAKNERWLNAAGGQGFHGVDVYRVRRVGKKAAGRLLDGREWSEMPAVAS